MRKLNLGSKKKARAQAYLDRVVKRKRKQRMAELFEPKEQTAEELISILERSKT